MTTTTTEATATVAAPDEARLLTADDLLRLDAKGVRGELIRGVLHETMPAGVRHGRIVMRLGAALTNFVDREGLGTLIGSDAGVRLERDPDTVREPDIAFFAASKLPPGEDVPGYAEVAPDLVVEIASPGDSRREVYDKARMWLSHGVRLVWTVHPDTRTVEAHRADRPVATLGEDDTLDGLDVLPGFACAVRALFGETPE